MPLHQPPVLDPLSTLLQNTPSAPASNVSTTPSLETLQTHARHYRWADVLSESSHLLTVDTSPPHETLLLQTYRTLALLQTRQTHRASQSISALGDLTPSNKLYTFENYPEYNPKTGTFVPFLLRFLSLDIRFRTGDGTALSTALDMLNQSSEKDERLALLSLLTSYALKTGFRDMAIDCAEMMTRERGNDTAALLTLSRVYLHLYDIENAERVLGTAVKNGAKGGRIAVCNGMIAAAKGEYETALKYYEDAINEEEVSIASEVPMWWVCAMNNSAICLLQLALLPQAVKRLEDAVSKAPERALQEGLVFNLATMYQLAFPDSVREKKKVLRKVAERFGRQGFDLEGVGL